MMKRNALLLSLLVIGYYVLAQPTGNPVAEYYNGSNGYPAWTDQIDWGNVIDMSSYSNGSNDFEKFENARDELYSQSGGVLYYPAGTYNFSDAPLDGPNGRGLMLKSGVVIRGAKPSGDADAKDGTLDLKTKFTFGWKQKSGKDVPHDWSFIGAIPSGDEELKDVNSVGIAWVHLVGATVYFGAQMTWGNTYGTAGAWKSSKVKTAWKERKPDGTHPMDPFCGSPLGDNNMYEGAGSGRLVLGCKLENATMMNDIINEGFGENGFHVYKFGSRIGIYGSHVFIANNTIPKPTKCFKFTQITSGGSNKTIVFDYADVNGLDVNKTYLNINSNKLDQNTGGYWEKGVVILDNYIYNHGRKGMDASGTWMVIKDNHNERDYLQEGDDVYDLGGNWELTLDGYSESGGASDNESRAYDVAGKALWIDGNSFNNTGSNPGNDGESILCQAHGGTQIHSWSVTRNKYTQSDNESNKGYLSGYDVHNYGMLVAWNDTKGSVGNLKAGNLYDCAFFPGPRESLVINYTPSTNDVITSCPSGTPNAPGNVSAVADENDYSVTITWNDQSSNEIGFRVERRAVNSTEWTTIAYRPRKSQGHADNEQKWIDYMAPSAVDLEYRVVAVNCDDGNQGASDPTNPVRLNDTPTSMPVLPDNGISIFPNPAGNFLKIVMGKKAASSYQMEIMDVRGNVVYTSSGSDNTHIINIKEHTFAKGLYLVKISTESFNAVNKVYINAE